MIALTIDCEQWNAPLLRGKKVPENGNTDFSRMGNEKILKILDRHDIKATFFVTGFFAEKEPAQVKKIKELGHEVACHGYSHLYRNNRLLDIEEDIRKAKGAVEKAINGKVYGFRAPQMIYSEKLLRVLERYGFMYDSSMHPAFIPFYYRNTHYRTEVHRPLKNCNILEISPSVYPKTRLPISWVWNRVLGNWWTENAVKKLLRVNYPVVLYFHSWEFSKMKSRHVPFYFNIRTGEKFCERTSKIIKKFGEKNFTTMLDIYLAYKNNPRK